MLRKPLLSRMATHSAFAAFALAAPSQALAQKPTFNINSLYGKSYAQVEKMLGKPGKAFGSPTNYGIWNLPNVSVLQIWWRSDTGILKQVQLSQLGAAGDPEVTAKKFGVTLGKDPLKFTRAAPSLAQTSRTLPATVPWGSVFVGYNYVLPFQEELKAFCAKKGLKPNSTFFWTIMVKPKRAPAGGRQVSAGGKA